MMTTQMMMVRMLAAWTLVARMATATKAGRAAALDPSRYRLAACPWNSTPCPHSGATTDYRPLNLDAGSDFGR
jgi:hypothetical protein